MNFIVRVSKIRKQFENKEIDEELLKDLYSRYAVVENIALFITTALNQFPKLNCGLASVYLQHLLGGKIIKGKYEDNNHTFLLVKQWNSTRLLTSDYERDYIVLKNCQSSVIPSVKNHFQGELMNKFMPPVKDWWFLTDRVVDITADQYGGPKVYVGELKIPWKVF